MMIKAFDFITDERDEEREKQNFTTNFSLTSSIISKNRIGW